MRLKTHVLSYFIVIICFGGLLYSNFVRSELIRFRSENVEVIRDNLNQSHHAMYLCEATTFIYLRFASILNSSIFYDIYGEVDQLIYVYYSSRSDSMNNSLLKILIDDEDIVLSPYHSDAKALSSFLFLKYFPPIHQLMYSTSSSTLHKFVEIIDEVSRGKCASSLPSHRRISSFNLVENCSKYLNSRKYVEKCMPSPSKLLPILVTGLGGSGTHFYNNLLRSMHIDVYHESLTGSHGSVSWYYAVNDVYLQTPYPSSRAKLQGASMWSPRFSRVIFLTRCPMSQISSLTTHLDHTFQFIQIMMKHSQLIADLSSRFLVCSYTFWRSLMIDE